MFRIFAHIHFNVFVAMVIMALACGPAMANNQFPEFSMSNGLEDNSETDENISANEPITIKRQLTRDILLLQEQVNILEALVQRQSGIAKIAENYNKIGIPFFQPLPERTICEKIPVNVLCIHAYPDLGKNTDIIQEAEIRIQEAQNKAFEEAIEALQLEQQKRRNNVAAQPPQLNDDLISRLSNDIAAVDPEILDLVSQDEDFLWADIQCVQSDCSALVVAANDSDYRMRVSVGDELPNNVTITNITPTRVVAKSGGEEMALSPLAIQGNNQPTKRIKKPNTVALGVDQNNDSTPSEEPMSNNDNELLGPTGLF